MRYFLFTYTITNNAYTGNGSLWIAASRFPSNNYIRSQATKNSKADSIVITGWNEFKNKKDFEAFTVGESDA